MMRLTVAAALAAAVSLPALAAEPLGTAAIRDLIVGNTVEGSMFGSGPYAEFYAGDGTIRGEGYTGSYTIEADEMCFRYGEDPATCWQVGAEEGSVQWIQDGEVKGTGTVREGNPNGF